MPSHPNKWRKRKLYPFDFDKLGLGHCDLLFTLWQTLQQFPSHFPFASLWRMRQTFLHVSNPSWAGVQTREKWRYFSTKIEVAYVQRRWVMPPVERLRLHHWWRRISFGNCTKIVVLLLNDENQTCIYCSKKGKIFNTNGVQPKINSVMVFNGNPTWLQENSFSCKQAHEQRDLLPFINYASHSPTKTSARHVLRTIFLFLLKAHRLIQLTPGKVPEHVKTINCGWRCP